MATKTRPVWARRIARVKQQDRVIQLLKERNHILSIKLLLHEQAGRRTSPDTREEPSK